MNESKDQLKKLSSNKFDKMLSIQKNHGDKYDLGLINAYSFVPYYSCVKIGSKKYAFWSYYCFS